MGGAIRRILWIMMLGMCCSASARIVINEVCYDPQGSDGDMEWIELFNSGGADVDLEGALILCGGSSYNLAYELPHYILRAQRFLLIGESGVANAVLTAELGFQNGGSETDGIRFVSPDGLYTDTVLYDSPNSNGLQDDSENVGVSFAPDAPEGTSLARRYDGLDTNDNAWDWQIEENPTPGLPNMVYLDYALLHAQIADNNGQWEFQAWVKNQSNIGPPCAAELEVRLDGVLIDTQPAGDLAAGDSVGVAIILPVSDELNHIVTAQVNLENDPDPLNNSASLSLLQEDLDVPRINEIMYDPQPGKQEWIEVWLGYPLRDGYILRDATGNQFGFSLPPVVGYYVLCRSAAEMLADYPECPSSSIVEVGSWAVLNNDGDTLSLCDSDGNCLDQMSYAGVSYQQGVSLERYPDGEGGYLWRYCLDIEGATPGDANSQSAPQPQFPGALELAGSPCDPRSGMGINLFYNLGQPSSRVNCSVYDRAGKRVRVLADNLSIPAEGSLLWDGRDSAGTIVPRGIYIIVWESRAESGGKTLRRQLTAVIYS